MKNFKVGDEVVYFNENENYFVAGFEKNDTLLLSKDRSDKVRNWKDLEYKYGYNSPMWQSTNKHNVSKVR